MSANGTSTIDPSNWDGVDISTLFSPLYWGTIVSMILSGVTIVQSYVYFPSKDHPFVQLMAASMLILDFSSTVMIAEAIYRYLIPHFGSLKPFNTLSPIIASECGLSAIIVLISQLYFCWQIRSLLKEKSWAKWVLLVLLAFISLAFVSGVGCTTVMITDKHNVLANRSRRFSILAGITRSSAAVVDVIATFVLCFYLEGSSTGLRSTDQLIKTLMQYVVQRGILLTIVQIGVVICFFASESRLYWLAFHVNVTRLYANTFFAMLNGRRSLPRHNYVPGGLNSFNGPNHHALQSISQRATRGFNGLGDDEESSDYVLGGHDKQSNLQYPGPVVRIEKSVKVDDI